jgi:hypothetical protein
VNVRTAWAVIVGCNRTAVTSGTIPQVSDFSFISVTKNICIVSIRHLHGFAYRSQIQSQILDYNLLYNFYLRITMQKFDHTEEQWDFEYCACVTVMCSYNTF